DRPVDLLRGGEALSALLLRATADGLATAPLSDAVEVDWPRHLVTGLLAGVGEPYVVVRLGYRPAGDPLPPAPRRDPRDVITIIE
ncbi:MAG: nitroreductase, partial [Actinoplanes sp.]